MSGKVRTFEEWLEFAQSDDCLANMSPNDLRTALNSAIRSEREACAVACESLATSSQAIGTQRAVIAAFNTAARTLRARSRGVL